MKLFSVTLFLSLLFGLRFCPSWKRAGRAGRTEPGVVLRLFSRASFAAMAPQPAPELLRVPLEVLSAQNLHFFLPPRVFVC